MKSLKALTAFLLLSASTSSAFALEDGVITIWLQDRDPDQLKMVTDKFTNDLGIDVVIENVSELTDKFQQAAATGDGPDIVLWAHDRFGEWANGGLISPVTPSQEVTDGIIGTAWDAVSFGGKVWGYPVAVEAIGLVYNTDLISSPPASFEELKNVSVPDGVSPILWDYNNTYFTFPMMMANGGFAFQKVDGNYDGKHTGVNNEGSMMGGHVLRSLFDDGVMPTGVDYGVMDGAMAKGEVAMIINGPWSWKAYADAGVNIAVAPLPTVDGKPAKPFLGVQAWAVNAASPNKDLAIELLENYILSDDGLSTWNEKGALGVLVDKSAGAEQSDPKIQATMANAEIGVPMPSNPEMGAFWSAMEPALGNITTGATSVEDALNDAAARILGE
ncbi:MAG: maltose/maltodextrin ABC transporter substrate-binding protein MalE [Hyphomicrobiaceae bacterium]|nr:maltose/maltodextrin ABC transporter substrate-binding protein MalE [Hyphomicrobiaceae bacterium]MCC0025316.1 maltose/maltodextrin ABC transporter substrate-binding protein MalE [Hyphomicrobiaceae bacterium]